MTVIALPAGFRPDTFSLTQRANQVAFSSPYGGSEQVVDRLNDRWMISLSLPKARNSDAAWREAFVGGLRGMTNTVLLWHFRRPIPRGSMRGAPTAQAALRGAASLTLNTTAAATLLAGDMIGVAGLLLQVQEDATASGGGVMVVKIVNRLRKAIAASSAVTWDKPSAPFRLMSSPAQQYVPGYAEGLPMDFMEDVAP